METKLEQEIQDEFADNFTLTKEEMEIYDIGATLEKVMENVVTVDPSEGKVYLTDLLGEQKIVDGVIKEIRLMDHKIILEEN